MLDKTGQDLIDVAHAWDRAMVTNDAREIGRYMADDWVIVGPDGTTSDKQSFLALIASGDLTHNEMTSQDFTVRVYGHAAIITSRGFSGGHYRGGAFREFEHSTNVFILQDGGWKCVHTHLSKLGPIV